MSIPLQTCILHLRQARKSVSTASETADIAQKIDAVITAAQQKIKHVENTP